MTTRTRSGNRGRLALVALSTALVTALALGAATSSAASQARQPEGVKLAPTKAYLLDHTAQLKDFTIRFRTLGNRYYALARSTGFDHTRLWATKRSQVRALLTRSKALWVEGNPYYERMEGVVAGTPSLSLYDVIIDAGSSLHEDPASAVPFDLELPDGRVLRKPGNFYNLTEGMLWGTRPTSTRRASRRISTGMERPSSAKSCLTLRCSRRRSTDSSSMPRSSSAPLGRGNPPHRMRSRP